MFSLGNIVARSGFTVASVRVSRRAPANWRLRLLTRAEEEAGATHFQPEEVKELPAPPTAQTLFPGSSQSQDTGSQDGPDSSPRGSNPLTAIGDRRRGKDALLSLMLAGRHCLA